MTTLKSTLSCRLCGLKLIDGKFKYIFEESTNLKQKIQDTLPVSISLDDNGSKYICMGCYDKVINHHKFIQDVVEYTREIENISKIKSLFDPHKNYKVDTIDNFFKLHSDAIYACPNCNVNLMILLASNPQDCDYSFQISLAIVDHSDKVHLTKEKSFKNSKNMTVCNNITKGHTNFKELTSDMVIDSVDKINKLHTSLEHENIKSTKRKLKDSCGDPTNGPVKTPKLEIIYETDPNILNCNYDSMDTIIKLEPQDDDVTWLNREIDCKIRADIYTENEQEMSLENNSKSDENNIIKPCPKIVCELCGARYLSQLKYEFHMERHKQGKMDKYICTVCDKEASSENLLWDHYYHTHKSLQRYACMECGKLFTKRPRLNGHQKKHKHSGIKEIHIDTGGDDVDIDDDIVQKAIATEIQGKVSVNCNLCGKLITDLDPDAINDLVTCASCEDSTLSLMVDGNEAKVISPRQYHCSKCPKHFVRKERLEFHEMRHNENMKEFICSTCGKEFSAENSLYEHYLFVHKGARPHICELCGKSFQLKARLKEHHRTHTGERPFQCDVCGQRCMTTNALKLHRKIHFSHNRYTCNICNKSFSKKQNMNEHLEKHWKHDKNVSLPQLFACPICLEAFPTYRMLKYHMVEIHKVSNQDPILTKQKPWYECSECHEKFKHQMSLKAHKERVHEGKVNPVYQCDICNATYRIKQLLINHIKSKHDGEKRYKCAQCEKGFNDTKSLYNHILLHTGKKPFVCEYCNMSFRRKDSRDHHRRKHTGEQPYQCPDCGESFSTYNNRSKHRKREHGEGETECPECGEKCNGQQEIRIHLNKHLGEKLEKLQGV